MPAGVGRFFAIEVVSFMIDEQRQLARRSQGLGTAGAGLRRPLLVAPVRSTARTLRTYCWSC